MSCDISTCGSIGSDTRILEESGERNAGQRKRVESFGEGRNDQSGVLSSAVLGFFPLATGNSAIIKRTWTILMNPSKDRVSGSRSGLDVDLDPATQPKSRCVINLVFSTGSTLFNRSS